MSVRVQAISAGRLEDYLDEQQLATLGSLNTPALIQAYLDETAYSTQDDTRCPLRVMQDRVAHCYDGGFFAAAALRRIGYRPLVIDLLPEPDTDDHHMLAIYKIDGHYGAVAKSNFVGLRYRDPVYRTLRELVMSYFELFYNSEGQKTLRAYTAPLDLSRFDPAGWECTDAGALAAEESLPRLRIYTVCTPQMAARLSPVDKLSYEAGMLGTNPEGLFKLK